MKKFTKVLLSLALAASMVVPAAMSVSAAELTLTDGSYGNLGSTGGCGFLDGNLYVSEGFVGDSIADISVAVNGKSAYFNLGYLGVKHCGLGTDYGDNKPANGWLQVGVVGADLVVGDNTIVVTDKNGNTLTHTFTSTTNALGTSYAKVTGDAKAKTAKAEIVFNTDPGFAVGTTFEGRCHDDHDSKGTFTVTKYDEATKMYTLESTDFATTQSLLELKVTSEGTYKDYWVSATINEYNTKVSDGGVSGDKITITEATINRTNKPGSNLIDGTVEKVEGGIPTESDPVIITFKTAEAVKINTMVLYTGGDDASWNDRAPGKFKLYGITADGTEVLIKDVTATGMENKDFTPYGIDIDATVAYNSYKMVITERIELSTTGNDWFQLGELEIYSDDAVVSYEPIYEVKSGAAAYNGTAPKAPDQGGNDTPAPKPAPTGDAMVIVAVVAVVALAGVAVVSKKRTTC